MKRIKRICRIALLAGCSALMSSATLYAGKEDNTLSWVGRGTIENIDPYYIVFREGQIIAAEMIYDSLVWFDPESLEYKPLLATEWTWLDDKTIEFKLREDVKWHDGTPFTADDAVYTFSHRSRPESKAAVPIFVNWIGGAEKTGDYSFKLLLKEPLVPAIEYVSKLPILPKDIYKDGLSAKSFKDVPGTGPYKVASFTPPSELVMEVNENYFEGSPKGKPTIKRITYRAIRETATQIAELLSGGTEWLWYLPSDQMANLASVPDLEVKSIDTMRFSYLTFTSRLGGPLADERVRKAIAHAIDRKAIAEGLVGTETIVKSACFKTMVGCDENVQQYEYDPELSKKLLAEAGYAQGLTLRMQTARSRDWVTAVAGYLEKVGIKTTIEVHPWAVAEERLAKGEVDLYLQDNGWNNINDISRVMNQLFGGLPSDSAMDQELIAINKAAGAEFDEAKRDELYSKALNTIADKMYLLPMWTNPNVYAFKKGLKFDLYPDENPRFYRAHWE